MKTTRMAYVVVVQSTVTKRVQSVQVFTNEHAANMCARQYRPERYNGTATQFATHMNDGRVSLDGV